jgi:hypothetical protein
MSRAEEFIESYTRNCSNEYLTDSKPDGLGGYISRRNFSPWLTPDQARSAVEIAREETLLNVAEWIKDNFIFSKDAKKDFCQTFNIKLL